MAVQFQLPGSSQHEAVFGHILVLHLTAASKHLVNKMAC